MFSPHNYPTLVVRLPNPFAIGTLAGTTGGMITATLPATIQAGTRYRIRVVSSNRLSPVATTTEHYHLTCARSPPSIRPICLDLTFS
jgi:hypothetical protein